ncbi:MAG TPA: serine protease [Mycobacteriales bacterium]|jgi:S1-C subfamily serine protease|nr:serine protease [Mycobacteriales bacterium]
MSPRLRVLAALAAGCLPLTGCVSPPPPLGAYTPPPGPHLASAAPASRQARMLSEARQFVYRVRSVACLSVGSAFDTTAGMVTNRHVAQGSSSVQVASWDGTDFVAGVDAVSRGPDLALLDSSTHFTHPARLSDKPVAPGSPVWVAGYPRGNQLSVTHGKAVGYVSANWIGEPEKVLEITARVKHGNSGGPVLNADGQVVAVVFAKERTGHNAIAVPISAVSHFLASPGDFTAIGCLG